MSAVEVEDPETGARFLLQVFTGRNGKEYYRRLPAHNTDVSARSARQLEAMASFTEVASQAYGKSSSPTEQAAAREVRERLTGVHPAGKSPAEIRSEATQAKFQLLVGKERDELIRQLRRSGVKSGTFKLPKRARPPRSPSSRARPEVIEELPPPTYY